MSLQTCFKGQNKFIIFVSFAMTISNIFPTSTDASAALRCLRISFKTDNYVLGMGFGGLKYFTYAMSDAEFVAYAKAQEGGILDYMS